MQLSDVEPGTVSILPVQYNQSNAPPSSLQLSKDYRQAPFYLIDTNVW